MASYSTLLEEALEAWQYVREGVIAELENVPAERFDFRPADRARSVEELARHILESARLAVGELTRADGDFTRLPYPDLVREHAGDVDAIRGRDALVAALRAEQAEADRRFREAGDLAMLQYIRRFDGQPGTRLAWIQHAVEHESYHRGQLATYARIMGLVPALTRVIYGAAAV